MSVSTAIRERVEQKVRETIALAENKFNQTFEIPRVSYKLGGHRVAGRADLRAWTIKLNPNYFADNEDQMINQTVVHEIAHLLDYKMYPENFIARRGQKRSLHGPTWKRIMMALGVRPATGHTMKIKDAPQRQGRRGQKFAWTCSCGGSVMKLGAKRHANMLAGARQYYERGHSRCTYTFNGQAAGRPRISEEEMLRRSYEAELRREAELERQFERRAAFGREEAAEIEAGKWIEAQLSKMSKSKKELARELFIKSAGIRGSFISMCEVELGMKKSTASTYHHNFKSGKWSV